MFEQIIMGIAFLGAVILGITTSRYLLKKSIETEMEAINNDE